MSFIATAKVKATKGNVKEAFKNEEGAIDLASIMVGIIVIGMIGGVIAATVFTVIPWSQDNAAEQQLDSIAAAQSAYVNLSSDKGDAHFGGKVATTSAFTIDANAKKVGGEGTGATAISENLFNGGSAKLAIGYWGTGNGAHYAAAVKSASGKTFYITDTKTSATLHANGATNAATAATAQAGTVADAVKAL